MNPSRPRSLGYYVGPMGQREDKFRTQPFDFVSNVATAVSGVVPGTPAYPLREAGAAGASPYAWDGTGSVPAELYELIGILWGMLGQPASTLPARSNAEAVAAFTIQVWKLLTQKSPDGCGLSAGTVQATIGQYEAAGPRAIAYALQELVRPTICWQFIKAPIADPTAPRAQDLPTGGSPMWPTTPGTQSIDVDEAPTPTVAIEPRPPAANGKGVPWGWIVGGVSLVALLGGGIYLATRKKKNARPPARRENPCACSNPSGPYVIETEGYELRENPYGSNQPLGGPAPATLSLTEPIREIPIRKNPRKAPRSLTMRRNPAAWESGERAGLAEQIRARLPAGARLDVKLSGGNWWVVAITRAGKRNLLGVDRDLDSALRSARITTRENPIARRPVMGRRNPIIENPRRRNAGFPPEYFVYRGRDPHGQPQFVSESKAEADQFAGRQAYTRGGEWVVIEKTDTATREVGAAFGPPHDRPRRNPKRKKKPGKARRRRAA